MISGWWVNTNMVFIIQSSFYGYLYRYIYHIERREVTIEKQPTIYRYIYHIESREVNIEKQPTILIKLLFALEILTDLWLVKTNDLRKDEL